jgi:hypothetical protein
VLEMKSLRDQGRRARSEVVTLHGTRRHEGEVWRLSGLIRMARSWSRPAASPGAGDSYGAATDVRVICGGSAWSAPSSSGQVQRLRPAPATYGGMCHIHADSVEVFQNGFGPHAT